MPLQEAFSHIKSNEGLMMQIIVLTACRCSTDARKGGRVESSCSLYLAVCKLVRLGRNEVAIEAILDERWVKEFIKTPVQI